LFPDVPPVAVKTAPPVPTHKAVGPPIAAGGVDKHCACDTAATKMVNEVKKILENLKHGLLVFIRLRLSYVRIGLTKKIKKPYKTHFYEVIF
jgi:hypothetical protein